MNFKKYGIGITTEKNFKKEYGINPNIIKTKKCFISGKHTNIFWKKHGHLLTERKLWDDVHSNIDFYKSIKSFRGLRHRKNYPVRGQRTHTNANKKVIKIPNFR